MLKIIEGPDHYKIPVSKEMWSEQLHADITSLPKRTWSATENEWHVPKSQKKALRALFMRHNRLPSDEKPSPKLSGWEVEALEFAKTHPSAIIMAPSQLWDWQEGALEFAKTHPSTLLDMYMATGKTRVGIELINLYRSKRTLILCPKAAISVWVNQIWDYARYPHRIVALTSKDSIPNRAKKLAAAVESQGDTPLVVITNYEAVWQNSLGKTVRNVNWDMGILDECHRIKAAGSKISRYLATLGPEIPYRFGLSGTPLPNSVLDVYGLYRFLQPSIFGTNYAAFERNYAMKDPYTHKVENYINREQFRTKYNLIRYHVGKDVLRDRLGMEEPLLNLLPVRLPKHVWTVYRQVEREFYAEIEEAGRVDAPNVLVKYMRLHQLESEFVTLDTKDVHRLYDDTLTAKQEILRDFLADFPRDEKLVVFCRFHLEIAQIEAVARLENRKVYHLTGARHENEAWEADNTGAVLAVNLAAGSEAVDLTAATYGVFWSLSYLLREYEQAIARLNRPGQRQAPIIYVMVPEGANGEVTAGRRVYNALRNKRALIDELVGEKVKND